MSLNGDHVDEHGIITLILKIKNHGYNCMLLFSLYFASWLVVKLASYLYVNYTSYFIRLQLWDQ